MRHEDPLAVDEFWEVNMCMCLFLGVWRSKDEVGMCVGMARCTDTAPTQKRQHKCKEQSVARQDALLPEGNLSSIRLMP